jgi:hypothetical protein
MVLTKKRSSRQVLESGKMVLARPSGPAKPTRVLRAGRSIVGAGVDQSANQMLVDVPRRIQTTLSAARRAMLRLRGRVGNIGWVILTCDRRV